MDYLVRIYHPGDGEEIVQLLELVFDGWPQFDLDCTPLEHWRWKYEDNPLKMTAISVGISHNQVIGCSHGFYVRVKIGDKVLLCQQGTDVAVHPDYRRMGVSTKMRELRNELQVKLNTDLTYNVVSNPFQIRSALRRGRPRFPRPVLKLVRINDLDLHLKQSNSERILLKKQGYLFLKALSNIRNIFTRPPYSPSEFPIKVINRFDERINLFWDETKEHYKFIVERNQDYLNWRYCDPRGGNYVVKQVEEDGHILGYSVLRINRYRAEYPEGYIVDLLTLPDRLDVASALITDAVHHFDDLEINIVLSTVVKDHPYETLFKRQGFLDSRTEQEIMYRPKQEGSEFDDFRTAPANQLQLQYGDTDSI